MRKAAAALAVCGVMLVGCGQERVVTQEDLDQMSEEDILAMGSCQMQKLGEEEGQEALNEYINETAGGLEAEVESGDVTPIQVELSERGYNCPEYLPE